MRYRERVQATERLDMKKRQMTKRIEVVVNSRKEVPRRACHPPKMMRLYEADPALTRSSPPAQPQYKPPLTHSSPKTNETSSSCSDSSADTYIIERGAHLQKARIFLDKVKRIPAQVDVATGSDMQERYPASGLFLSSTRLAAILAEAKRDCLHCLRHLLFDEFFKPEECQNAVAFGKHGKVADMSSSDITMAALGRPFSLGMLYDARREKLIPGFSLFADETLQQYESTNAQRSSEFKVAGSDSIDSKSNSMEIEASLGASFLGGLVDISGSAKYLYDTKKYQNQSRVTLTYKATTVYKQFTAPPGTVTVQHTEIAEKGLATHVVTGILYGANAYLVFDSEKLEDSNTQEIQGRMEAVIEKLITIEGSASIQLNDEEKDLTSTLSCKFHGDFLLESLPTTFEEAVTTCQELPKLLGEDGAGAIPIKVWLVPLKKFHSKAEILVREISLGKVRKIQTALEDLEEVRRRCHQAMDDKDVKHFPLILDRLKDFNQIFQDYCAILKQKIAEKLPLIRAGSEDQGSLEKILAARDKSPFSNEKLGLWMDTMEREICAIKACVGMMDDIETKFVSNQTELDREVLAPDVKHGVCFVFTSLGRTDYFLRALTDYMESRNLGRIDENPPCPNGLWCFSPGVVIGMKQKAQNFSELARSLKDSRNVRFYTAALQNDKYQGASIYYYMEGTVSTQDFTFPRMPYVEHRKSRTTLLWCASSTLSQTTVSFTYHSLSQQKIHVGQEMRRRVVGGVSRGRRQRMTGYKESCSIPDGRLETPAGRQQDSLPTLKLLQQLPTSPGENMKNHCFYKQRVLPLLPFSLCMFVQTRNVMLTMNVLNVLLKRQTAEMTSLMSVAALGRPFSLGMLYDARKDELVPGWKLWDDATLAGKKTKVVKPYSAFQISASDSIEARSSLLDVNAEVKASFLSGLIEVGGSAKYLSDKKEFRNQSRVTCQYNATTTFEELSVIQLDAMTKDQLDVIQKGVATHVVVGIVYGANAVFVFDSQKVDSSNVQDIQGSMQAVIKKIPSFSIEGKVDIQLTAEEKSLTDKFSCKFYGDFILDSNPATFKDAVKTYVELPKLLGKDGENSVPLKVWLMPLKYFDTKAAELMKGISIGLVRKVQDTLEDLRQFQMRCNDALVDPIVKSIPVIKQDVMRFQRMCKEYEAKLQKIMSEKFPLIRDGKEDESAVEKLLADRETTPFSSANLERWMKFKEKEINIVWSCVRLMDGVKILQSQSELDREVMSSRVEDILCFVFTSLDENDPTLNVMNTYLNTGKSQTVSHKPWYDWNHWIDCMHRDAQWIHELHKALSSNRFLPLIAVIKSNARVGSTIFRYKNAVRISNNFQQDRPPKVQTITDKYHLIWCKLFFMFSQSKMCLMTSP
ncbi:uncharacterized protein V6R79_019823 [Siganus canaliculatus]